MKTMKRLSASSRPFSGMVHLSIVGKNETTKKKENAGILYLSSLCQKVLSPAVMLDGTTTLVVHAKCKLPKKRNKINLHMAVSIGRLRRDAPFNRVEA